MGNLFDLDNDLLKEEKPSKDNSVELRKARALCIRGQKDRALEIYNAILEEDFENEQALLGILRVHSENFRIYEGKQIEDDVYAIESMCPDIMDEEYLNYISKRNDALKSKKEEKKEEPKKEVKEVKAEAPKKNKEEDFNSLFKQANDIGEDDYQKAIDLYLAATACTDDKKLLKKVYYEIGWLYKSWFESGEGEEHYLLVAIDYFNDVIKLCSNTDDYYYLANFFIGDCYKDSGDYETALEYFDKSKEGFSNGWYGVALCHKNLGNYLEESAYLSTFINTQEYKSSNYFLKEALYEFGMLHYDCNDVKKNLVVAKKAFQKLADLGDKRGTDMLKKL